MISNWHAHLYDLIGACGAALILFGFYRISIGRWTRRSLWYELDNIAGPGLLITYQIHHHAYIGVVLNAVWVIVAFRGVISFVERSKAKPKKKKTK